MKSSILRPKKNQLFIANILITALITWAIHFLYLTNSDIFYQTFNHQIVASRIDEMIEKANQWQWLGYALIPLVILLRVFLSVTMIYIGVFFTELRIEFSKLFKVAILADFIYVFSGLTKLIILIFFKNVSTLEDLQFTPLSIIELLEYKAIDPLFLYPLSLINIFEIGYFLVLAWLLVGVVKEEAKQEINFNFGKSLKLVTASYGSGLLLWVILVMFITLNLT